MRMARSKVFGRNLRCVIIAEGVSTGFRTENAVQIRKQLSDLFPRIGAGIDNPPGVEIIINGGSVGVSQPLE